MGRLTPCLLLALVGCRDLPEITYETEHLQIGTSFDTPMCQAELDRYELIVTTLESTLDTTLEEPIEVYVWDMFAGDVPNWCFDGDVEGCYGGGKIYSSRYVVGHELVHAVVGNFASPKPFWGEGTAKAFQIERTFLYSWAPSDSIDAKRSEDVNYAAAGHFARWVFETYGPDKYRELLRAKGSAREAFETTYGISFEDAEQRYFDEAPDSYGAFVSCEYPELTQVDQTTWFESIQLECSDPGIYAAADSLSAGRVLTIEVRGDYSISTNGALGSIARCRDETYLEAPDPDDVDQYGDVPAYTPQMPTGYFKGFGVPAEPLTLDLTPGRYRIFGGLDSHELRTVEFSVELAP